MKLAHIGFLYKSIDEGLTIWKNENVKILKNKTKDKKLKVNCCLLKVNSLIIEIISPFKSNKILFKKIENNKKNKPFGFDHLCFYSKNINKDIKIWEKKTQFKNCYKENIFKDVQKKYCIFSIKNWFAY